jgi:hypothetical protein
VYGGGYYTCSVGTCTPGAVLKRVNFVKKRCNIYSFSFQIYLPFLTHRVCFNRTPLTFKTNNTNMSVVQVQHVFCLMGHIETKTFTDAHVPCLTEFSIKTFFNATCTLFPFSRKLTRRQERNKAHKVQTSQNKKKKSNEGDRG